MKTKGIVRKSFTVLSALLPITLALFAAEPLGVSAEKPETRTLVTQYADLWTSTEIAVRIGEPVKWYVTVPEDTEPKGCGATIKIPDLGFGTDTHDKTEGHIVLQKGENFICEFTPEEAGDILFTCWMGSGCHSNYIHATEDGTYSVPKPSDPTEISAVRDGDKTIVSFKAPEAPAGSVIKGYTVTATADDGSGKKATVTESPATFEGLDKSREYTIAVVVKSTSGKSAGENKFILEAVKAENDVSNTGSEDSSAVSDDSSPVSENDTSSVTDSGTYSENVPETNTSSASGNEEHSANNTDTSSNDTNLSADTEKPEVQEIVTEYEDLWTGNITVRAGVPVKWYVNVPEGTELIGCGKTIKIPGLGLGTDTRNKDEGHLTLEIGKNFVYEFTPEEAGDILFTCWMGSGCHYNYIHVISDGNLSEEVKKADGEHSLNSESNNNTDGKTVSANENNTAADGFTYAKPNGSQRSASVSISETKPAPKTVSDTKTESAANKAADNGSTAAVQSAAVSAKADTNANSNPVTGNENASGLGRLAVLMLLTVAAAAENRKNSPKK